MYREFSWLCNGCPPPPKPPSSSSSSSSSSHGCGSVDPPCPSMLHWTPSVASYLLHHSSRYFKESATFALGLNYVQFAKLGLKPLGGGKALWPIYQCSFFPSTNWDRTKKIQRARARETDFAQFPHTVQQQQRVCEEKQVWRCYNTYLFAVFILVTLLSAGNKQVSLIFFFMHHNWPSSPNHRTKSFSFATKTDSKLRSDKKTKNKNGVCVCFTCSQQCCYLPSRPLLFQ